MLSTTSYYDRSTAGVIDMTEVLPSVFGMTVPVAQNLDDYDSGHGFTEEVRLSSDANKYFSWLIGAFYQNVYTQFQQSLIDPNFNNEVFGGAPVVPNGVFLVFLSKDSQAQTAEFASGTYHVTSALDLTAGIRYFRTDDTTWTVGDGLFNGGPTETNSLSSDSGNTPSVTASYKTPGRQRQNRPHGGIDAARTVARFSHPPLCRGLQCGFSASFAVPPLRRRAPYWRSGQMVDLIHVDDGAQSVLAAEDRAKAGETYLIADGHPMRRREFYTFLAEVLVLRRQDFRLLRKQSLDAFRHGESPDQQS